MKGFCLKAPIKSKCNNWCIARCEPQPGQLYPVIYLKGQGIKKECCEGLYKKYTKKKPPMSITMRAIFNNLLEFTENPTSNTYCQ